MHRRPLNTEPCTDPAQNMWLCVVHQQNTSCSREVMGKYFINLLDKYNDKNPATINLHSMATVSE